MITFLQTEPHIFVGLIVILGLFVGSFLNVIIYRLPVMKARDNTANLYYFLHEYRLQQKLTGLAAIDEGCPKCHHQLTVADLGDDPAQHQAKFNLAWPPSNCPHCQRKIRFYENIPLLSYCLILFGRCAGCQQKIAIRYPAVELLTAILSGMVAWYFGVTLTTLLLLVWMWYLIVIAFIDYDHQLIFDETSLPLMWLGILAAYCGYLPITLSDALLGAVFGYLSLWSVYQLFKLLFKKEGMGYGDFKLLAALGAWLGVAQLPLILILASLSGSILGITALYLRKNASRQIPFGPYLVMGGIVTLFYQQTLYDWWNYIVLP